MVIGGAYGGIFCRRNLVEYYFAALYAVKSSGQTIFDHAIIADIGDIPYVDRASILGHGGGHYRLGFEYGRDH